MRYQCPDCHKTFDRKSNYTKHMNRQNPCVIRKILPTPSDEQMNIIKAVGNGHNVMVNAVAGSGKSTTTNLIAKHLYPKKILVITYNRRLMDDSNLKAKEYGIDNIEIRTYHSLCSKLHNPAPTDSGIIKALAIDNEPEVSVDYDIIIIDETQDCKELLYNYMIKVINQNTKNVQLVILGDVRQNIYKFNGTDSRFLSLANMIIDNGKEWKNLKLSTSYRLTPAVADFVNKCILDQDIIVSGNNRNKNIKPEYHIINGFDDRAWGRWVDDFIKMLKNNDYRYDDVFILASSVSQKNRFNANPVTRLENALVCKNIPCNAVTFDDEQLNDDTMRGKVVFSTFHSVKGLERKVIVVLGMEDFFYNLGCNKNEPLDECPNILYVACTRVLEKMIIIHNGKNDYIPFLRKDLLPNYTNIKHYGTTFQFKPSIDIQHKKSISCRDFVRNIPEECFEPLNKYFNVISEKENSIVKNTLVSTSDDQYENVADIIGVAIVEYAVISIIKDITIRNMLLKNDEKIPKVYLNYIESPIKRFTSIKHMFKLANLFLSYCGHGFLFKIAQLNTYDFITQDIADLLKDRLNSNLSNRVMTEQNKTCTIERKDNTHTKELEIHGRCDIIDKETKTLWEVKCKQSLTTSDKLQLAIYAVAHKKSNYKYKLINLYTNEIIELTYDDCLRDLLGQVADAKYKYIQSISDIEFINKNNTKIIDKDIEVLSFDDSDDEI